MKSTRFTVMILLALSGVLAVPAVRAEEAVKEKKVTKTTAKYDTNNDGVLSAEEQAAMKAEKEKAKAERKAKKAKPAAEAGAAEPK